MTGICIYDTMKLGNSNAFRILCNLVKQLTVSRLILIRVLLILWGVILIGLLTAFSGWFHPGCLVVEPQPEWLVPGPPGPPCLPTPPPPGPGETPTDTSASSGSQQTPVRLTIFNGSELPFSITLTGPGTYVLNVASGEERVFVMNRGVYSFEMMLCGVAAQGAMNVSKITTLTFKPCSNVKLVQIAVENKTGAGAAVTLSGPGSFVFSIPPGETRMFTIPRGDYALTYLACGTAVEGVFEARSHRTLSLTCP